MAIGIVKNDGSVGLKQEVTEGTYVASSAGTDYIQVMSDVTPAQKTREELSRDTLSGSTETEASRVGIAEVVAELPIELSPSATEGGAPQSLDLLFKSLLGGSRSAATQNTTTGNTSTVLEFGATPNFAVGDCVVVQEAGAFEIRPVSAVGATTITLAFALTNGAPSDGVTVGAVSTYYSDTSSSISLSMEDNVGNTQQQRVAGLRASAMSLNNWSAGNIPNLSFSLGGLSLERVSATQSATPDFTADALPPVALEACLFVNGSMKSYSELGMSIENTLSFLIDACNANGKVSSRITSQSTSMTAKVYADDTALTEWNNFNNNDDVSIFFYAHNPTSTDGEYQNFVAVWMPQCKITAIPFGDQEGIVTDELAVRAHRSSGNDSVFISFS